MIRIYSHLQRLNSNSWHHYKLRAIKQTIISKDLNGRSILISVRSHIPLHVESTHFINDFEYGCNSWNKVVRTLCTDWCDAGDNIVRGRMAWSIFTITRGIELGCQRCHNVHDWRIMKMDFPGSSDRLLFLVLQYLVYHCGGGAIHNCCLNFVITFFSFFPF